MNRTVSILIPVYNAEKYLRECLDSVLSQSFPDFEVICCNDGSTDGSLKILEEYAAKDPRIVVLSKKNEGSSATRNVCLERASGKYWYFVDNDDMIAPETLNDLYRAAEDDELDVVYANPTWIAESPGLKDPYANVKDPTPAELKVQSGARLFVSVVNGENYYAAPWRRFIRSGFAKSIGLRFNGDASPNEDNLFSFYVDINAKRAKFLPRRYYIHRSHANSTMTQLSQNIGMGRSVVSHELCAFEIMRYCAGREFPPDVRAAILKRLTTLANGALRFFDRSKLKPDQLDWRGHWVEQHLFQMQLRGRGTGSGAVAASSPAAQLTPPGASPAPGESVLRWKLKRLLKRFVPMPHSAMMRELYELRSFIADGGGASGAAVGDAPALRGLSGQLEMLQRRLCELQRGLAESAPAANWRQAVVEKIELFFIRVDVARNFSHGVWKWRYQCMIRISGRGCAGWSELTIVNPENIHRIMTEICRKYYGNSIGWGLELCRSLRGAVADGILESLEMALLDLAAQISGKNILDFLHLEPFDRIPYLECVLQKDPEKAAEYARMLARKYLKIKLFGDSALDVKIVRKVRSVIPEDCYLIADVNLGYLSAPGDSALSPERRLELAADAMRQLREAGLNACEDPAPFSLAEMQKLQSMLPDMPIIPDAPMRPGYRLCRDFRATPGQIYNLHPHCMGSVRAALRLARSIREGGGEIMIGDNSLIGVGCIQWQLIAGGCRARWCEAVEKKLEGSDLFAECLEASPIRKREDGYCEYLGGDAPGFGIRIDIEKLKSISKNYIVVSDDTEI